MTLIKLHKYISLLVSIQLLLWTISGIYFTFNKIENVRGEQYLKIQEIEVNQTQKRSEKLSHEIIKDIVVKETYLQPINIMLIQEHARGSEYRGKKLPIYKVTSINKDNKSINIYIDAYSGKIVAIRSKQWRIWDLMWGFHIMDWIDRDNIDNILLKIFSFLALFTSISGIVLFFKRR
jgi:uncharacterized iron-regulated membrane protein